jgi:putative flippase GtrA
MFSRQFLQYLYVGGLNTGFGYGVFALCIYLDTPVKIAVAVGHFLGIIFNYFTYGKLVFKKGSGQIFAKFLITYGLLYLENILLIDIFFLFFDNPYVVQFLSLPFVVGLSYLIHNRVVFK